MVTRLDRLARGARDLLNILDAVAKAGAKFKSLHDAWADTSTAHGELMVTILAGLATFERHLIRARTDEGRKRAQARGVRFGRPRKLTVHQRQEAMQRLAAGETQAEEIRRNICRRCDNRWPVGQRPGIVRLFCDDLRLIELGEEGAGRERWPVGQRPGIVRLF